MPSDLKCLLLVKGCFVHQVVCEAVRKDIVVDLVWI